MNRITSPAVRNLLGLAAVFAGVACFWGARQIFVEPAGMRALCDGASAPLSCQPRSLILFLQIHRVLGSAALAIGAASLLFGFPARVCASAALLGSAAVTGYDATLGVWGAAMGFWAWLSVCSRDYAAGGGQDPARAERR